MLDSRRNIQGYVLPYSSLNRRNLFWILIRRDFNFRICGTSLREVSSELHSFPNPLTQHSLSGIKLTERLLYECITVKVLNISDISADIMNGQMLQELTSLKYLGAGLCKDGTCSAEIRIRIAFAVEAMA